MTVPTQQDLATEALLSMLTEVGYTNLRFIDGKLVGTLDYFTTRGIVIGLDEIGCERRYCYKNRAEATRALAEYTDTDQHPSGNWIKHKGRYRGQVVDDFNPNWSES